MRRDRGGLENMLARVLVVAETGNDMEHLLWALRG